MVPYKKEKFSRKLNFFAILEKQYFATLNFRHFSNIKLFRHFIV